MPASSAALRRIWQPVALLPVPADSLTAVRLPDDSVIALGGDAALQSHTRMAAELAPDATSWTRLPDAPVELDTPAALALGSTSVLVVAPAYANGSLAQPSKALILEPQLRRWLALPSVPLPLLAPRLLRLDQRHVLAVGAVGGPIGASLDLRTTRWTVVRAPVRELAGYTAVMVPGKGVLLLASIAVTAAGLPVPVRRAFLLSNRFDWRQVARPPLSEDGAQAEVIDPGRVLFAGGRPTGDEPAQPAPPPLLYNSETNTWTVAGSTGQIHRGGLLVALGSGQALLIGGHNERGEPTAECLLFDGTGWHRAESLPGSWAGYAVVGLPDSRVLLIGGDRVKSSTIEPVADAVEWSLDPGYPS